MSWLVDYTFARHYGGLDVIVFSFVMDVARLGVWQFIAAALVWLIWCAASDAISKRLAP